MTSVLGGAVVSEVAGFKVDQKLSCEKDKPDGNKYVSSMLGRATSIRSGSVVPGVTAPVVNLSFK